MNLLFRKNFREGGNKSAGGSKLQPKSNRTKRSRDTMGGGGGGGGGGINNINEDIHYRTHLFFAPSRGGYEPPEEKCSGISGFSNQLPSTATAQASIVNEVELPQPLVDRRPSVSLIRWNQQSFKATRNDTTTINQLNTTIMSTTTTTNNNNNHINGAARQGLTKDLYIRHHFVTTLN